MMENAFHRLLRRSATNIAILDGGMGTSVEDRGIEVTSDLWGSYALCTDEGRNVNFAVHRDFVAAGAEFLLANLHSCTRESCEEWLSHQDPPPPERDAGALHAKLIERAVRSAKDAAALGEDVAVGTCVASLEGPFVTESESTLEETCQYLEGEIRPRQSTEADVLVFETLTTLTDMQGVARAARLCGLTDLAVGLTCREDGKTVAGVSMAEAVAELSAVRPLAYFIQCMPYDLVERALTELVAALDGAAAVGVYANDGRTFSETTMGWSGERVRPADYAAAACRWRDLGARLIGGCCGTHGEHVRQLKTRLG